MASAFRRKLIGHVVVTAVAAAVVGAAWLLACGPFLIDLKTVQTIAPAHRESYGRGELGIVRPRFARRFLVQAYRRINGQTALPGSGASVPFEFVGARTIDSLQAWQTLRSSVQDAGEPPARVQSYRRLPAYQAFENCLEDAFISAAATLKARRDRYGTGSPELRSWIRAQDAVFANCGGEDLTLPEPAPSSADPLAKADRAYQTAAAYFYAMRFDEAERRFRAIAEDADSPWRLYGRYLAARSAIRSVTVPDGAATTGLAAAAADLQLVLKDPSARTLHESAQGLLDFVDAKARPIERVQALSKVLSANRTVTGRQLLDYERVMDRLVGDTTSLELGSIKDVDALIKDDDLTSWVLAMQGTDQRALELAVREWERQRSVHWLVAVLWKMPAGHAVQDAALAAAAAVPRDSPAAATVTFLRVRALARGRQPAMARGVLASAPRRPVQGFPAETINLLEAERFMLATSFEELLRSAPRMSVVQNPDIRAGMKPLTPVFDDDAGIVFSERLPLARLVVAGLSDVLPPRLRLRVATIAFTRAVLLKRYEPAVQLVPVLRTLAPALAKDLEAFERTTAPDARHRAAVLLLLRTPGMHMRVQGIEDDWWFARGEAARTFEHTFRRNWWCAFGSPEPPGITAPSELPRLLFGPGGPSDPAFLTAADRAAVTEERRALAALGPAPNYLSGEAVAWARARPQDLEAAEALALSVEGTRWGCSDARTTVASRRAFQVLHQLFPKTEWARRTKYWY